MPKLTHLREDASFQWRGCAAADPPGMDAAPDGGRRSVRFAPAMGFPLWKSAESRVPRTFEKQRTLM